MNNERRCLVQISLDLEEESLLRCLAAAEGVAPASLAHQVLIEGLRCLLEDYGGLDALRMLDTRPDRRDTTSARGSLPCKSRRHRGAAAGGRPASLRQGLRDSGEKGSPAAGV